MESRSASSTLLTDWMTMSNQHVLGRIEYHDPRNKLFRALVQPPPRSLVPNVSWWTRDVYDQRDSPQCTAEAAVGLVRTAPLRYMFTHWSGYDTFDERRELYIASQQVDPWPGSSYDGTSTDAPFRVLRDRGVIVQWRHLFGEAELREWLTWYGPAVAGTTWTEGMFDPDPKTGYIVPSGNDVGGHAYRIVQYNATRQAYRIVNSWSRYWGQEGRAWIKSFDMARLLEDGGEIVTVG